MSSACALPHGRHAFTGTSNALTAWSCSGGYGAPGRLQQLKFKRKSHDFHGALQCELWRFEDRQLRCTIQRRKNRSEGRCECTRQGILPDEAAPSTSQQQLPLNAAARPLASSTRTYLDADLSAGHKFWVIAASTSEEFLAAATLRAQIFYSYPPPPPPETLSVEGMGAIKARVAHDFLVADLLKTRVKSEYNRESKMEALGMRVKCLLAVCTHSALESLSPTTAPPYLAPPTVAARDGERLVAIGTLDIQDGTGTKATADDNLVTFQLYALAHRAQQLKKQVQKGSKGIDGFFPVEQECTLEQGYIFNLCVVHNARRRGVAKALMEAALQVAKQMELKILYVHVEASNRSAAALYGGLGYAVEEEEPVEAESILRRPRRMLLSFWVS